MKKIYVIVVTYNGERWIEHCLKSVYKSSIDLSAILIDNGSTDKTVDIVKLKYPQCKIIETNENLGFGRANNLGIQIAISKGAEYIYLLNQDAWITEDCIETLINIHIKNPNYGILSPIQLTGNGNNIDSNFLKYAIKKVEDSNFICDCLLSRLNDVYETGFIMAAHWLIYVPYLNDVGIFSSAFPHYGEDNNLVQRYIYKGYKVGLCPHVYAYHDREYRSISPQKSMYLKYINLVTTLNNPLIKYERTRIFNILKFVIRVFKHKDICLNDRFHMLLKAIKAYKSSFYYRKYYKTQGPFIKN